MDMDQDPRKRLYFSDGRRKVDYVLVYHSRKRSSVRGSPGQHRLSIISNGSYPLGVDEKDPEGGKGEPAGVVLDIGPTDPGDGEKIMIREEFEGNLKDAGLEIEHDREVSNIYKFQFLLCCISDQDKHPFSYEFIGSSFWEIFNWVC